MPYNPITNQYDPDTNDFSNWFNTAGQQQQQPNLNYAYGNTDQSQQPGTIGDGTVPAVTRPPNTPAYNPGNDMNQQGYGGGPLPGQPMDPNSPYFQAWLQAHSGNPTSPNPYSDGSGVPITGTNQPNGVDFSSPTTVPSLTSSLPQPVVGTGNPGNDRNNPPGPGYFWSGTANHWVDSTGQHDATGRLLNQGEQDYWNNQNTIRASNTARGINTPTPSGPGADITGAPTATAPAVQAQPTATTATSPFDYSKQGSVPWWAFEKNVYADSNAQQSFKELQGTLTPEQLQQASQVYGWQQAVDSTTPDANAIYAKAIEMAKADPNSDYHIVQVALPNGSTGYGVLKRENGGGNVAAMQAAQSARGYISPAVAISRAQALPRPGGNGGGYSGGGGAASLPKPLNWPAANFNINNYQIPAEKNPANVLGQPGIIGQKTSYGGKTYTYNGATWVADPSPVPNVSGGGSGGLPPQAQTR